MNFLVALLMGVMACLVAIPIAEVLAELSETLWWAVGEILRLLGTLVLSLNSWVIGKARAGISQAPWPSREQRRKQREKLLSLLGHRPRN